MILDPKDIVSLKAVKGLKDPKLQIQPNGIDLRVGKIFKINGEDENDMGVLDFDNKERKYPSYDEIKLPSVLHPDSYIVQYAETVEIPKNAMAQVFMRSSLQRMGAFLFTSVYDSGYVGKGVGLLILTRPITILPDARIGQIVFHDAKSSSVYEGIHKGEGVTKEIARG